MKNTFISYFLLLLIKIRTHSAPWLKTLQHIVIKNSQHQFHITLKIRDTTVLRYLLQQLCTASTWKGFQGTYTKEGTTCHCRAEHTGSLSQMPFWKAMLLHLLKIECSLNSWGSHGALGHSWCEPSAEVAGVGRRSEHSHYPSGLWWRSCRPWGLSLSYE